MQQLVTAATLKTACSPPLLSVPDYCYAQAALDLAHQLCLQHRVFERPLGLLGVWGGLVREWLHTLLPNDAANRCSGRVRIVITTLPLFQREVVTDFKVRQQHAEASLQQNVACVSQFDLHMHLLQQTTTVFCLMYFCAAYKHSPRPLMLFCMAAYCCHCCT